MSEEQAGLEETGTKEGQASSRTSYTKGSGERKTSRMLGSIVSCLCRSSLGGSIIFICPYHFVGLFVL